MNPFIDGGDVFVIAQIGQAIHTGVWEIDGTTLEQVPVVVSALPNVENGGVVENPDGTLTVQYDILPDAIWADGTPISGDDFAFTLEMILVHSPDVDIYEDIVLAGDSEFPERAPVATPSTFSFTLRVPTTAYELLFDTLIPKHDVEGSDFPADWNEVPWVSGGPFVFESWTKGESLVLSRNRRYWKRVRGTDRNNSLIHDLTFRFYDSKAGESVVDAFVSGEIDIFGPGAERAVLDEVSDAVSKARIETKVGPVWEHLNFQFQPSQSDTCSDVIVDVVAQLLGVSKEDAIAQIEQGFGSLPYTDATYGNRNPVSLNRHLKFRQAVAYAIDKQRIVDDPLIAAGLVPPLDSYVDAFNPTISKGAWQQYGHDPARATALMQELRDELGDSFPENPTVVFSSTAGNQARVRLDELLEEMLAPLGLSYVSALEPPPEFFSETLDCGTWDLGEWAWVGAPGLSGLVAIHENWDPGSLPPMFGQFGTNWYRWGTPGLGLAQPSVVRNESTDRFAELFGESRKTIDEKQLVGILNEMETLLADEVVFIPLFQRPISLIWHPKRVAGVVHNPTQSSVLWNVEEWYKPSRRH